VPKLQRISVAEGHGSVCQDRARRSEEPRKNGLKSVPWARYSPYLSQIERTLSDGSVRYGEAIRARNFFRSHP